MMQARIESPRVERFVDVREYRDADGRNCCADLDVDIAVST